jgi:hypothetical protein
VTENYTYARAIAEGAANRWGKCDDAPGIEWLTDKIMQFGGEIDPPGNLAAADAPATPPVPNRDYGGRLVREAWVRWARTQPDPKSSWLVPYEELSEPDKEADRQIAEALWSVRALPPVPEDVRLVERLTRERDEAREQAHYANGVADLAMKHRDHAEARPRGARSRGE